MKRTGNSASNARRRKRDVAVSGCYFFLTDPVPCAPPPILANSCCTSSHMWPCNVSVSLQKGQVSVAPSVIASTGYSVLRPQIGHVKGIVFCLSDLLKVCLQEFYHNIVWLRTRQPSPACHKRGDCRDSHLAGTRPIVLDSVLIGP